VEGLGLAGLVESTERPSTEGSSSSSSSDSGNQSDSDCYDSNEESASVFPSEREEGLHQEATDSSTAAIVSPSMDKGNHYDRVTTPVSDCIGATNYSRLLQVLLRSAHPLHRQYKENDDCTKWEGPRYQSIVVSVAATSGSASETFGKAEFEMKDDATKDLNISGLSLCPSFIKRSRDTKDAFIKDHLLLKIAADSEAPPSSHTSKLDKSTASTTVINPGSLRTKGEFCLVDLILDEGLSPDENPSFDVDSGNYPRSIRWRVERTHFHRLEDEGDT